MNSLSVMLQATNNPGGGMTTMLLLVGMVVIMWVLMMRPQRKKAKEEQKFRESLKKGDRVVFSGGIYGKVHSIAENTVDVEVSNGVVMTVEKAMIQPAPEEKPQPEKK